jgi:hypothetical protein
MVVIAERATALDHQRAEMCVYASDAFADISYEIAGGGDWARKLNGDVVAEKKQADIVKAR